MAEHPIILRDHEVRAILAGRQTQFTRAADVPDEFEPRLGSDGLWYLVGNLGWYGATRLHCPYRVGDTLLGKETWAPSTDYDGNIIMDRRRYLYRADQETCITPSRWRSPVIMPRRASRLSLLVAEITYQQLQAITEEQAVAEGVDTVSVANIQRQAAWSHRQDFSRIWDSIEANRAAYMRLWDSIEANRAYPWDANPWVRVTRFEVVER